MPSHAVVLITDRPDGSAAIEKALNRIGRCQTLRVGTVFDGRSKPRGIVADATLGRWEADTILKRVVGAHWALDMPVICLLRSMEERAIRQAKNLGATLCLPASTAPAMIAQAFLEQAGPQAVEGPVADEEPEGRIERGVWRATEVIGTLFDQGRAGTRISTVGLADSLEAILSAVRDSGVNRWLDKVWTHDDATYQHCLLVAGVAAQFALHLGFGSADRHHFVGAALLHDLGKAKIPLAILNKAGRLDADETAIMREHPLIGYEILRNSDCDALTLGAVRHHHEMLDGSGYPDGLSGDAIGDTVRLLTICDIYAALVEQRSYKKALSPAEAMSILTGMGGKLEGGLVQIFGRAMAVRA